MATCDHWSYCSGKDDFFLEVQEYKVKKDMTIFKENE
jgi:hypothetical protein